MAATEADRDLHRRMLDGDPIAPSEAAERFLDAVVRNLRTRFPKLRDEHWADEAAAGAVFGYLAAPGRFDPEKCGLLGYLTMAADGDLKNLLATERRRSAKRRTLPVELPAEPRKEDHEEAPIPAGPPLRERLAALKLDRRDVEAMLLILAGERSTGRFAALYGLSDRPAAERTKLVKRHKDRLKKILERRGAEAL